MTAPYYEDDLVTLHHGDATAVARTLESGSVQTIVTSPPYFGLRDYGEDGQMGAEATLDEYVSGMVGLFHELRRVLANGGTLWLNLGDSYSAGNGEKVAQPQTNTTTIRGVPTRMARGSTPSDSRASVARSFSDMPAPKNLLGVPWRVAFALQADGWILRSDIIWAKPNPMPESVTDRPTKAHEYVFLFAKSPRYHYDAAAVAEPSDHPHLAGKSQKVNYADASALRNDGDRVAVRREIRNKRSVWTVPTAPFPGAHFAVYPPDLIRPCILAGSREGDTVLDPFSGSGTTGMVATQEGRKYVGIDLNSDYLDLSLRERFAQPVLNFGGAL